MKNIIAIFLPRKSPDNNVETTQIQAIQNVPSGEKTYHDIYSRWNSAKRNITKFHKKNAF